MLVYQRVGGKLGVPKWWTKKTPRVLGLGSPARPLSDKVPNEPFNTYCFRWSGQKLITYTTAYNIYNIYKPGPKRLKKSPLTYHKSTRWTPWRPPRRLGEIREFLTRWLTHCHGLVRWQRWHLASWWSWWGWNIQTGDWGYVRWTVDYPLLCQNSYWKWPLIVDFPIKHGDFP